MATFIQSSKSFHFPSPNKGEPEFKVPFGFVGEVPAWVPKTKLFDLAVKSKDITFIGQNADAGKAPAPDAKVIAKTDAGKAPAPDAGKKVGK